MFVLRNPDDANKIGEQAKDRDVVICGASFIGMELASSLSSKAKSISVCEFFSVPFERILGKEVSQMLLNLTFFLIKHIFSIYVECVMALCFIFVIGMEMNER